MGGVASLLQDDGGLCGEPGHLLGPGPPQGTPLACDGHPDVLGVCPPGTPLSVAGAAAYWRLPADILCGVGACLQAPWPVATDGRGMAGRPGPFDACAAGRGVPRLGHRALPTPLTPGIVGGDPSHVTHERSGGVNARHIHPAGVALVAERAGEPGATMAPLRRPRSAGWPWRACGGCAGQDHRGACPSYRPRPRRARLCGHPSRCQACATGTGLTAELVQGSTGGGSGCWQAHPR
jgi:hypothetical protein